MTPTCLLCKTNIETDIRLSQDSKFWSVRLILARIVSASSFSRSSFFCLGTSDIRRRYFKRRIQNPVKQLIWNFLENSSWKSLAISAKSSILDGWQGSKYASESFLWHEWEPIFLHFSFLWRGNQGFWKPGFFKRASELVNRQIFTSVRPVTIKWVCSRFLAFTTRDWDFAENERHGDSCT